jgi:hypothetical protein
MIASPSIDVRQKHTHFSNTRHALFDAQKDSSNGNTASFSLSNVQTTVINAGKKKTKKIGALFANTVIMVSGVLATRAGFELTMSSLVQGPC